MGGGAGGNGEESLRWGLKIGEGGGVGFGAQHDEWRGVG